MAMSHRRSRRSPLIVRGLIVLAVGLVLFLYYRPVKSYLDTSQELSERQAEVRQLRAEQRALQRKLALTATKEELQREARRIGYVQPGERLYIVKNVEAWRARQEAAAARKAAQSQAVVRTSR
jgi:cell division protein FtsB